MACGATDSGQDYDRPFSCYNCSSMPYDDFPVSPSAPDDDHFKIEHVASASTAKEVSFSGQQEKGCVCIIDMINSTKTVDNMTESDLSRYYSIFLNDMATIILNFGGTIIKNGGDALMYYFSMAAGNNQNSDVLRDVVDSGITMMAAHEYINAKLKMQGLPPLNYRISSDYGTVTIARSTASQKIDLFGSVVNHCAKINSTAPPNGMVIGNDLYQTIRSISGKAFDDDYLFEKIGEYPIGAQQHYTIYSIQTKPLKDKILNPFTRTSARISKNA